MKPVIIGLVVLFLALQYQLWCARGGLFSASDLKKAIARQSEVNLTLKERNDRLKMNIKNLKQGKYSLEEHARNELGMVKQGETFYQVVKSDNRSNS